MTQVINQPLRNWTFIILSIFIYSCKSYKEITWEGPIQTVDEGHILFGGGYKHIKVGKKIETDTTTSTVTSLMKYRIKFDCMGDVKGVERTRNFDGGIYFRWLRHSWKSKKTDPSCRWRYKNGRTA